MLSSPDMKGNGAGRNFCETVVAALHPLAAARNAQRANGDGDVPIVRGSLANPHRRASLQDSYWDGDDAAHDAAQQRRASAAAMTTAQRAAAARARRISMTLGVPDDAVRGLAVHPDPYVDEVDDATQQAAAMEVELSAAGVREAPEQRRARFTADASTRAATPSPTSAPAAAVADSGEGERQHAMATRRSERRASRVREVTSGAALDVYRPGMSREY